jgi:hypothetical protein
VCNVALYLMTFVCLAFASVQAEVVGLSAGLMITVRVDFEARPS